MFPYDVRYTESSRGPRSACFAYVSFHRLLHFFSFVRTSRRFASPCYPSLALSPYPSPPPHCHSLALFAESCSPAISSSPSSSCVPAKSDASQVVTVDQHRVVISARNVPRRRSPSGPGTGVHLRKKTLRDAGVYAENRAPRASIKRRVRCCQTKDAFFLVVRSDQQAEDTTTISLTDSSPVPRSRRPRRRRRRRHRGRST